MSTTQEDLRRVLEHQSLEDLLRVGMIKARQEKKPMVYYFLEMALFDTEQQEQAIVQ